MTTTTPISLTTRATLLSKPVTWSLDGDQLTRQHGERTETVKIADIHRMHAWRGVRARGIGGHVIVRLRTERRTYSLDGHHAAGVGRIERRDEELLVLLRALVHRRRDLPGSCSYCVGSPGQRLGGWILLIILVVIIGAIGTALVMRPPQASDWKQLAVVGAIILALGYQTWKLWRGGRRVDLDAQGFLDHPRMAGGSY